MKVEIGPGREHAELEEWETDAFVRVVEAHTKSNERQQLSYALRTIRWTQGLAVQDGFQRNARKMWRPELPAGS